MPGSPGPLSWFARWLRQERRRYAECPDAQLPVKVAATGEWVDPEGRRLPAGEVHGWTPGQNATVCRLQLSRSGLRTFRGVSWEEVQPASGGKADAVQSVCPRCAAASGAQRDARPWTRHHPRP